MGNQQSSQQQKQLHDDIRHAPPRLSSTSESGGEQPKKIDLSKYRSFPGSAILEKTFCGSIDTTDPSEYQNENIATRLLRKADIMCVSSPISRKGSLYSSEDDDDEDEWSREEDSNSESDSSDENSLTIGSPRARRNRRRSSSGTPQKKQTARLLARALVSEVTDNPKTMKPAEMAAREKKLLRAQEAATKSGKKAVGAPGVGVGPPRVLSSLAYACTGDEATATADCLHPKDTSNNPAAALLVSTGEALGVTTAEPLSLSGLDLEESVHEENPFAVTIAVCMSRRSTCGHPDTITRQTAFDLNQVQDRAYKYVASTDKKGWRAGGGEPGGIPVANTDTTTGAPPPSPATPGNTSTNSFGGLQSPRTEYLAEKDANMDSVHIPILHINCKNKHAVDQVIHALASGDIFIPHMTILPDSLSSVQDNKTLPDLCLRFDCDRNDEDTPPEEWNNWCLEFMHNQLYEYFCRNPTTSPVWMPRPFNLTLARGVRWKTVKHMNRYFCHGEQVLAQWKEQGPQHLDPLPAYMDGGACPEEVAHPHGIYLLRKDLASGKIIPTNYFAPNFDPPYTTKMTRSLLKNVLGKSWDTKRQEWTSRPQARLLSPGALFAAACGCSEGAGGFVAKEVTVSNEKNAVDPAVHPTQHTPTVAASPVAVVTREPSREQTPESSTQPAVHAVVEDVDDEEDDEDDPFAETLKKNSQEDIAEEKKMEDHQPATNALNAATGMSRFALMQQHQQDDSERPISVAASGFMSVAASGTTVVAANISSSKKLQKTQSKQLFSDEDWSQNEQTDENNSKSKNIHSDPPGNKVTPLWAKKKKSTSTAKDERPPQTESTRREKKTSTHYKMQPVLSTEKRLSPSYDDHKDNESGFSLEYSLDGSSAIFTANDNSTLLGQNYAAEADSMSISTLGQRQQPLVPSHKTAGADAIIAPEPVNEMSEREQIIASEKRQGASRDEKSEDNVVRKAPVAEDRGRKESTVADEEDQESLATVIPTDAELFAIGWAKALDPGSGNYYYFTLDRSKTVWENPLTDDHDHDDLIKRPVDP